MSKNGLILTSLVGAIPGGIMTAVMIIAFVKYAGGSTILHQALCGLSLLIGLMLAAMPIGIFVLAGPKKEKSAAKAKDDMIEADSDDAVEAQSSDDLIEADDDSPVTDDGLLVEEGSAAESAVTGEVVVEDESDDMLVEEFDEVEEETPKKGKK